MQTYSIIISNDAKRDLDDIWSYVALNDLPAKADILYDTLETKSSSLSYLPERGRRVYELESMGIFDFREIIYTPYRIIYKFINPNVIIHGVLDGRRDLTELLQDRMSDSSVFI